MRNLLFGHLRRRVDSDALSRAMAAAERGTTGRIVVAIAPHLGGDASVAAQRAFAEYALHDAKDRNAVLFFVIPSRREFAIWGGAGIHDRVGQAYWDRLSASLAERMRSGDLTTALALAIEDVGKQLAAHFPQPQAR